MGILSEMIVTELDILSRINLKKVVDSVSLLQMKKGATLLKKVVQSVICSLREKKWMKVYLHHRMWCEETLLCWRKVLIQTDHLIKFSHEATNENLVSVDCLIRHPHSTLEGESFVIIWDFRMKMNKSLPFYCVVMLVFSKAKDDSEVSFWYKEILFQDPPGFFSMVWRWRLGLI